MRNQAHRLHHGMNKQELMKSKKNKTKSKKQFKTNKSKKQKNNYKKKPYKMIQNAKQNLNNLFKYLKTIMISTT